MERTGLWTGGAEWRPLRDLRAPLFPTALAHPSPAWDVPLNFKVKMFFIRHNWYHIWCHIWLKNIKESFCLPDTGWYLLSPPLSFLFCSTSIATLYSTGLQSDLCNREQFTAKAKDEPEGNHTEKSDPWENHIDLEDHWFSVIFFCFCFSLHQTTTPLIVNTINSNKRALCGIVTWKQEVHCT